MKNIFVFVPNTLKLNENGYLQGFYRKFDDCEAFYVTSDEVSGSANGFVGYLSNSEKDQICRPNAVHIDTLTNKITLPNRRNVNNHMIKIIYDLEAFRNSQVVNSKQEHYGVHFQLLTDYLRNREFITKINGKKSLLTWLLSFLITVLQLILTLWDGIQPFASFSATSSHCYESLATLKWFLSEFIKEKAITPKLGNVLVSKMVDLAIGLILLQFFIKHERLIVELIGETREIIIHNLKELLTYLMGSPIGLKLNKAFNNCLGTFFFYHISLWRIFLHTLQPIIANHFTYLVLPGAFGFSFQIAMLSDIISIATFHVYCIYVYAARLIHVQLRSLLSLWRLFIGRKYNPLRQRVDSYEYSQHQLFIGTLGFTVLLFLLPTTMLYYTVFTIFRLGIVIFNGSLLQLRHLLYRLPIYVTILWLCKSPNMAGTLYLNWKKSKDDVVNLEANLNTLPLPVSIKKFTFAPETTLPTSELSYANIFKRIFTGVLI